jgi:hypothetical protein
MVRQRAEERIELLNPGDGNVLFDLSKGCCLYPRKLEKGAFVRITIDTLTLRARITYSIERTDGCRVGMQFWGVSGPDLKHLEDLVDRFSRGVPLVCNVEAERDPENQSAEA